MWVKKGLIKAFLLVLFYLITIKGNKNLNYGTTTSEGD